MKMTETGSRHGTRKHTGKAARRNMATTAVRVNQGHTSYRGATRSRDTQVMGGHPLTGLWTSLNGMRRSHRRNVRAYARKKLATFPIWDGQAVAFYACPNPVCDNDTPRDHDGDCLNCGTRLLHIGPDGHEVTT